MARFQRSGPHEMQFALSPQRQAAPRPVLAMCPTTGEAHPTHARLTDRAFGRLKSSLSFWCSHCRSAHQAERQHLWLHGDPPADMIVPRPPLEAEALRPAAVAAPPTPAPAAANEDERLRPLDWAADGYGSR